MTDPVSLIITPSYDQDFERCRLLCESVDRYACGLYQHDLIVDNVDYKMFRSLQGSRRNIVVKEDILPRWVKPTNLRLGRFRRRVWVSFRSKFISGWLMQQIAKMAIAKASDHHVLAIVDSDVCFTRPFDLNALVHNGKIYLYRVPGAIAQSKMPHRDWCETAMRLLSINASYPLPDFISQLVVWHSRNVTALCDRIEQINERHWIAAIANKRRFSEYITYGMFIEGCLGQEAGHYYNERSLCHSYWEYDPLIDCDDVRNFLRGAEADQVAIGIQSISGTPIELIRASVLNGT